MRLLLILLVLLPIFLGLAAAAPPKDAKTMTPTATATSPKKGRQLVYYSPTALSRSELSELQDEVEDEDADENDTDQDDEVDEDDDVDQDDDADDDGFQIPDFNEVFPNPDGRPVGPNSYDAFMKHKPGGQPTSGPGAAGLSGPRVAGQGGPRVSGHSGPGKRRFDNAWRSDVPEEVDDGNLGLTPPFPGARLLQIIPADDPTSTSNEVTSDNTNVYPTTRGGRRQNYGVRVPMTSYHRRPVIVRPVQYSNRRNYNYVPYQRPSTGVFYGNQQVVRGNYPVNQYRVVQATKPVRRNSPVVAAQLPVPMAYRPRVKSPYVVPTVRAGTGRGYNPQWSYSPIRADNYNPEYVINQSEMLSRRHFRYHPSQRVPAQRIPMNFYPSWGGASYDAGY